MNIGCQLTRIKNKLGGKPMGTLMRGFLDYNRNVCERIFLIMLIEQEMHPKIVPATSWGLGTRLHEKADHCPRTSGHYSLLTD